MFFASLGAEAAREVAGPDGGFARFPGRGSALPSCGHPVLLGCSCRYPGPRLGDPAVGALAAPVGAELRTDGASVGLAKAGGPCPAREVPPPVQPGSRGASASERQSTGPRRRRGAPSVEAEGRHRRGEARLPAGRWSGPRSWRALAPALTLESLGGGRAVGPKGPGWETGLLGRRDGAAGACAGAGEGVQPPSPASSRFL